MHGHTIHTVAVPQADGTVLSKLASEEQVLTLAKEAESLWPPSPAARLAAVEKALGMHKFVSPMGKVYRHDADTHELVHVEGEDAYAVTAGAHVSSNLVTIDAAVFAGLVADLKGLKKKAGIA